jgi:hypothetical protein
MGATPVSQWAEKSLSSPLASHHAAAKFAYLLRIQRGAFPTNISQAVVI